MTTKEVEELAFKIVQESQNKGIKARNNFLKAMGFGS